MTGASARPCPHRLQVLCSVLVCRFRIYDTPQEAFSTSVEPQQPASTPAAAAQAAAAAAIPAESLTEEPPEAQAQLQAPESQAPHLQTQALPGHGAVVSGSNLSVKVRSRSSHGDSFGPALRIEEGELIYDYAWFPCMSAADPASCCFASTSRAHPVHLWDACTG